MTGARLDDDTLQRYFDGELPPDERDAVRLEIAGAPDNQARLESLQRLHELLAVAAEDVALSLSSDDLYARVRAGIRGDRKEERREPLQVITGGRSGPVEGWKVWLPAATGLAVAAAILLFVLRPDMGGEALVDHGRPHVATQDRAMTLVEPQAGSEVERVDFGENVGTVFAVEGAAGEPIAVVWINDAEPEQAIQ